MTSLSGLGEWTDRHLMSAMISGLVAALGLALTALWIASPGLLFLSWLLHLLVFVLPIARTGWGGHEHSPPG